MNQFLTLMLTLAAVMIANIILGLAISFQKQDFDLGKLIKGGLKALMVAGAVGLLYVASMLTPDIIVLKLDQEVIKLNMNLLDAMTYVFTAAVAWYGGNCILKLTQLLGMKTTALEMGTKTQTVDQNFNTKEIQLAEQTPEFQQTFYPDQTRG